MRMFRMFRHGPVMVKMEDESNQSSWYFTPLFVLFWFALFYVVVLPVYHQTLPDSVSAGREHHHTDEFIGERAAHTLFELDLLGPKQTGTDANQFAVEFLMQSIAKVRRVLRNESYEMAVEVQTVSGMRSNIIYRGVQNVIVKLQSRNISDDNYLLINSHFDTTANGPGAGDAGQMVAVMLELLRVFATSEESFIHPIVFLFNGAEESYSLGSHGFGTHHPWAKKCKAFINLDSYGSGDQETLLYTYHQHNWLTKYYARHAPRPFGSSLVSEINDAIPNIKTDDAFLLQDILKIPGLDFVCLSNHYVYHTPHDKYFIIPHSSLQAIGSNMLALTRALANADELSVIIDDGPSGNHTDSNDSPLVYYDFLRLFMVSYTNTVGILINSCMILCTLLVLCGTLWRFAAINYVTIWHVTRTWLLTVLIQSIGCVLAVALPCIIAVLYDKAGTHSMALCWYTNKWLVLGLYVCPALLGLGLPILLYLRFGRHDELNESYKMQLSLHAQAVIVAIVCLVATIAGFRSSYLFTLALCFHIAGSVLIMLTTLYGRKNYWIIPQIFSQLLPFMYFSYTTYVCLQTFLPRLGVNDYYNNPDIHVALICAMGAILCFGFVMPIMHVARHGCLTLVTFLLSVTMVFVLLTLTPLGFPYRETTHMQRLDVQQVQRVYFEQNERVDLNESGFHLTFKDRRGIEPILPYFNNNLQLHTTTANCSKFTLCTLPHLATPLNNWLPVNESVVLQEGPELSILQHKHEVMGFTHFVFELSTVTPRMNIYVMPIEGTRITNTTFLGKNQNLLPYYNAVIINGNDKTPFQFFVEVEKMDLKDAHFQLAIGSHYDDKRYNRSQIATDFLQQLPPFTYAQEWMSLYEVHVF